MVLQRGRENSFVDERLYTELPVGAMEVVLRDAAETEFAAEKKRIAEQSRRDRAARLAAFASGAAAPAAAGVVRQRSPAEAEAEAGPSSQRAEDGRQHVRGSRGSRREERRSRHIKATVFWQELRLF